MLQREPAQVRVQMTPNGTVYVEITRARDEEAGREFRPEEIRGPALRVLQRALKSNGQDVWVNLPQMQPYWMGRERSIAFCRDVLAKLEAVQRYDLAA